MRLLALDLATTTGCAFGAALSEPRWWTLRLKGSHGARFAQLYIDTRKLIRANHPDLILIERAIAGGAPGGASRVQLAMGLRASVMAAAFMEGGVRVDDSLAPSTIRKHFIGHGRLPSAKAKREVGRRCVELGWPVDNDNESDALALWHYGACRWGERPSGARGGLFDDARRDV